MSLPLSLLLAQQAYCLDPDSPIGREVAGSTFLEAYLKFGGNERHHLVVADSSHGEWFHQQAIKHRNDAQTLLTGFDEWGTCASATGAISLPGPGIDEWAWKRMPWGDAKFSLVGLVHTLCSKQVQWGLGQFCTAPVRSWDTLICTSSAAKNVVEGFLERQEKWLHQRLDAKKFERPQLPVIPLGVHPEQWKPEPNKQEAQKTARNKLLIDQDAIVVLIAGRLDILTKFHPGPLFRVLADLQRNELPKLELLVYGEAPNFGMKNLWLEGVKEAAPFLPIHWVAGRQTDLSATVRWAADLFISLPDNPQETFGLTPLEAMAAELPCLVSDWDGYKDTVSDEVGVRIPTRLVEGLGSTEVQKLLNDTLSYDHVVGRLAQGVAVDPVVLRSQLLRLLSNKELLLKLGKNGRQRVKQYFTWESIIGQWRELLVELKSRRRIAEASGEEVSPQMPPWLPNLSTGFEGFASTILKRDQPLYWACPNSPSKAIKLLTEPFDYWDEDLINQLNNIENMSPDQFAPRVKGWLLKQGLLITQQNS